MKKRLLTWPTQLTLSSIFLSWCGQFVCKESFCGKRCYFTQHHYVCWPSTETGCITRQTRRAFITSQYYALILISLALKISLLFTWFLLRLVWIVSSYYWIKECLLSWPTQITLLRYMFQLDVAIWKQRMFCGKTCCFKQC